ncbi:MAG: hypothetical protein L0Z52_07980 [Acidobacteria bacterium]|nr:hypothetical protein [Acidobacteriota bacterium]
MAPSMSSVPSPQSPPYRITLFYGPEPVEGDPVRLSCVFNVKKRSWKGGIQVAVELDEGQVARARQTMGFEEWMRAALAGIPEQERADYADRAQDLFVQGLCALKLDLAIEAGLQQANCSIEADALTGELDRAIAQQEDRLKSQILTELDISG